MSPRRLGCAAFGLGLGLLFYLAYRSDLTLSNRLLRGLCGPGNYIHLKQAARHGLPLPVGLRGCLPSALWCFIATSLCGGWKMRLPRGRTLALAWAAPLINAGWETIQWLHWTDGRADGGDVVAGVAGWAMATLIFAGAARPRELPAFWTWRTAVVVAGIACMGLADVWK